MVYKKSVFCQTKAKNILNTLDLTEFIKSGKTTYDIINEIKNKYGNQYNFIFEYYMDDYDFMKYLKEKYKINFKEIKIFEVI